MKFSLEKIKKVKYGTSQKSIIFHSRVHVVLCLHNVEHLPIPFHEYLRLNNGNAIQFMLFPRFPSLSKDLFCKWEQGEKQER